MERRDYYVLIRRARVESLFPPEQQLPQTRRAHVYELLSNQVRDLVFRLVNAVYTPDSVDAASAAALQDEQFLARLKSEKLLLASYSSLRSAALQRLSPDKTTTTATTAAADALVASMFKCDTLVHHNANVRVQLKFLHDITNADQRARLLRLAATPTAGGVFPGALPVSFLRQDMTQFYSGDFFYVLTPKTDGVRFLLVFGVFLGQKMILLINRSLQMYLVDFVAPDVLFRGTVFDGELVALKTGRSAFLIYDCVVVGGVRCHAQTYKTRMQLAGSAIQAWCSTPSSTSSTPTPASSRSCSTPPSSRSRPIAGRAGEGAGTLFELRDRLQAIPKPERDGELDFLDLLGPTLLPGVLVLADKLHAPSVMLEDEKHIKNEGAVESRKNRAESLETGCAPYEIDQEGAPFLIRVKYLYSIHSISDVLHRVIPHLDHVAHGLILTAVEPGVTKGRTPHMYKIKLGVDHTIDFRIRLGAGVLRFYCVDGQKLRLFHKVEVDSGMRMQLLDLCKRHRLADDVGALHDRIAECQYVPQKKTWIVRSLRLDKNSPNSWTTVQATWRNIRENLSLSDLFPAEHTLPQRDREFLRRLDDLDSPWTAAHTIPLRPEPIQIVAPSATGDLHKLDTHWTPAHASQRGEF